MAKNINICALVVPIGVKFNQFNRDFFINFQDFNYDHRYPDKDKHIIATVQISDSKH